MGMGNMGGMGGSMSGMGNMSGVGSGMGGLGGNMSQGMPGMPQGMSMQRQMSPSHGGPQGQGPTMGGGNAVAGPSSLGPGIGGQGHGQGGGGFNQIQSQQALQILNTPSHPAFQYLIKTIPGFESMPTQQQIQKMRVS